MRSARNKPGGIARALSSAPGLLRCHRVAPTGRIGGLSGRDRPGAQLGRPPECLLPPVGCGRKPYALSGRGTLRGTHRSGSARRTVRTSRRSLIASRRVATLSKFSGGAAPGAAALDAERQDRAAAKEERCDRGDRWQDARAGVPPANLTTSRMLVLHASWRSRCRRLARRAGRARLGPTRSRPSMTRLGRRCSPSRSSATGYRRAGGRQQGALQFVAGRSHVVLDMSAARRAQGLQASPRDQRQSSCSARGGELDKDRPRARRGRLHHGHSRSAGSAPCACLAPARPHGARGRGRSGPAAGRA